MQLISYDKTGIPQLGTPVDLREHLDEVASYNISVSPP
jgi:hypothetical protein